ncbi:MAG: iron-containing alcohol dehydrogenase [Phascolarctobacterium sp.]|nr:iron-containing alcohol dehydrogenase [Phascolarctobacterium sp.]
MDNFGFHAPTQVIFGKGTEAQVGALCKEYGAHKVLVHFGGSSAKKSGLLDRVCASLTAAGLEYVLLGGVVPNPLLSKVYEGIELGKKEGIDFILAVGGGSVIDSSKAIAYGMANEGDVWDYYARKKTITASMPVASVLTMAAAGSEMSNASVITKDEGMLKRGLSTKYAYCKFSILNPELTYTLPAYQTASGCTDIMVHTLERYFLNNDCKALAITDSIAEQLLKNVMRNCRVALKNPTDYDARAEIMWCSTLSHNDTTGDRSFGDWACHQLEHELSGMFGIAHGAGLAAVWGTWARYVYKENPARFAKLAVNVFGIPCNYDDIEATALKGIAAMESFFRHIGMPTDIHTLIGKELSETEIKELAYKCSFMQTRTIGQFKKLNLEDMENIYRLAK